MNSEKKPKSTGTDWKNITLEVRKISMVIIGLDGWGDPVHMPVYAQLGKRANVHYPTFFYNMDHFLANREELGLEIAIDDDKERKKVIEQFKKMEKAYATQRKNITLIKTIIEEVAHEEAEKEEEPTDKTQ